jgi:hypothetical protein
LWNGTSTSFVDLTPAGATSAEAVATSGGQQVGTVGIGQSRASLWTGTAASWVDLTPAGATQSSALAVGDGQQGGFALVGGVERASLWSGTAASWIDLNPEGAFLSDVFGIGGGQQVGRALVGSFYSAALWSGSAASYVSLQPAGAEASGAYATSEGRQVGYVIMPNGEPRAALWTGTADSWVDLSTFLPAGYLSSSALAIWSDSNFLYVAGYGTTIAGERDEALLWMRPVPAPSALAVLAAGGWITMRRRYRKTAGVRSAFSRR